MKEIKLTGKHGLGRVTLVDDEDFEALNKFKWNARLSGDNLYAYTTFYSPKESIFMHRILMNPASKSTLVDHKDRNSLNNQKCNLRFATPAENNKNRKPNFNSTSKYLGVSLSTLKIKRKPKDGVEVPDSIYKYWVAQIQLNGKTRKIGYFKDEISAALAYNEAAIKYHGEFANPNVF